MYAQFTEKNIVTNAILVKSKKQPALAESKLLQLPSLISNNSRITLQGTVNNVRRELSVTENIC